MGDAESMLVVEFETKKWFMFAQSKHQSWRARNDVLRGRWYDGH
jgi:hypothetical protein